MGVPQRSPLSPVVFLIWMAPILEKVKARMKEEAGRMDTKSACGGRARRPGHETSPGQSSLNYFITKIFLIFIAT